MRRVGEEKGSISRSRTIQYPIQAEGNARATAPMARSHVGVLPGPQIARHATATRTLPMVPAITPATATIESGFSWKTMGAVGMRPVVPFAAGGSGSWIVTSPVGFAGMVIGFLHFGQGPVRPANWSLTVKRDLQPEQTTEMAMDKVPCDAGYTTGPEDRNNDATTV